jgi:hypothetical protein
MTDDEEINPPPALLALSYPHSMVVHAATNTEETLCNVTTWGQMERYDAPPDDKRLCNNCSLILKNRDTWKQGSPFADAWLERRRREERA